MMIIARPAPTPIAAVAPAARLSDVDCGIAVGRSGRAVTVLGVGVVLLDAMLEGVFDEEVSGEVEAFERVEESGGSVDPTCPLLFSTTPRA